MLMSDHLSLNDFQQLHRWLCDNKSIIRDCFKIDDNKKLPIIDPATEEILMQAGIIKARYPNVVGYSASCRILDGGGMFITTDFDGPISDRVFPWIDEGILLNDYLSSHSTKEPSSVLNLCSGAGTVAIGAAKMWVNSKVLGIDINPRAVEYAHFNVQLNSVSSTTNFECKDLSNVENGKFELVVCVPPFAMHPEQHIEYSHSAGGKYGDDVVRKVLSVVNRYLTNDGRMVMLCYSLGDENLPTRVIEALQSNGWSREQAEAMIVPLKNERIWRFRGEKRIQKNPMPVQYMAIRAGDDSYRLAEDNDGIERFVDWIENDLIGGSPSYTCLHYIIIDTDRVQNG